jgi:hypothetical protein
MATIDIFNDDAFRTVELTGALDLVDYQPQWLGSLNLFESRNVRTETVAIEKRNQTLRLVPTTPRGAPLPQLVRNPRDVRDLRTVRVAKGDRLNASEIAGIRAFGSESELMQVQAETLARMISIRNDVELTHENMRLAAVQGLLVDADGTVIYNYFDEFGITQSAEIDFDLDNASPAPGVLAAKARSVRETMRKKSKGAWSRGVRVIGLAGDAFWEDLVDHAEVRETYQEFLMNADARAAFTNIEQGWGEEFTFGGINWVHYLGTDDDAEDAVEVPTDKVKFFPVGAPGAFLRVNSPGEALDHVGQPGQEFYALTIPDKDRNFFVDLEVYSYPLYVPTRPEMLLRGKRT